MVPWKSALRCQEDQRVDDASFPFPLSISTFVVRPLWQLPGPYNNPYCCIREKAPEYPIPAHIQYPRETNGPWNNSGERSKNRERIVEENRTQPVKPDWKKRRTKQIREFQTEGPWRKTHTSRNQRTNSYSIKIWFSAVSPENLAGRCSMVV